MTKSQDELNKELHDQVEAYITARKNNHEEAELLLQITQITTLLEDGANPNALGNDGASAFEKFAKDLYASGGFDWLHLIKPLNDLVKTFLSKKADINSIFNSAAFKYGLLKHCPHDQELAKLLIPTLIKVVPDIAFPDRPKIQDAGRSLKSSKSVKLSFNMVIDHELIMMGSSSTEEYE